MAKLLSSKVEKVKVDLLATLPEHAEERQCKDARFCHDCALSLDFSKMATWRVWELNHYGQTVRKLYVCDDHKGIYTEKP